MQATWKNWLMAIRPPTLLAGLGPVLIGISFGLSRMTPPAPGEAQHAMWMNAAAVLLVVLLQSAANLVNDAKDAEKGIDSGERLGPVRVVQRGLLSLGAVKRGYGLCFALAALLVAALFVSSGDWLIIVVAACCGLAAYAYTAGPFPLSYYALGEAVALIFFGPIAVMGTSYLHTHRIDLDVAFWGLGPGWIAAAIMAINNFRDRRGDALAGKHTLATLLGKDRGRLLPLVFLLVSALLTAAYGLTHDKALAGLLLAGASLIVIFGLIRPLLYGPPAALNQALKRTALFNFVYALGFMLLVGL